MYLYRTQQKVLATINSAIVANRNPEFKLHISDIIKEVPAKRTNVIKAVTSLSLKGYVVYGAATEHYTVGLTKEGLHAFATWEFIVLQEKVKWTAIRDSSLVITNLCLAIIAVYSLIKANHDVSESKIEMQQLQGELRQANSRITSLETLTKIPVDRRLAPALPNKAITH